MQHALNQNFNLEWNFSIKILLISPLWFFEWERDQKLWSKGKKVNRSKIKIHV